jgi:hypothetical protein
MAKPDFEGMSNWTHIIPKAAVHGGYIYYMYSLGADNVVTFVDVSITKNSPRFSGTC